MFHLGRLVNNITKSCGCRKKQSSKKNAKNMLQKNLNKNYKEETNLSFLLNKKLLANNKSGKTGVCWNSRIQQWTAYITIKKKRIFLGYFKDKNKAIRAREKAEEKYFKPILDKYRSYI